MSTGRKALGCVPLLCLVASLAVGTTPDPKPLVVVLATGGTIAGAGASPDGRGYSSGALGVEQLIAAVPQVATLATLEGEQVANIGWQDMTDALWLKLARRVNAVAARPDVAGIRRCSCATTAEWS